MVFKLQFRHWRRLQTVALALIVSSAAHAADSGPSAAQYLADAQKLYQSGQYFKSARYAFAAIEHDDSLQPEAYAWITLGLVKSGLYHSASYFFIRTLQEGNKTAIHRVLTTTQDILVHVGADLLRKYLIRHTTYDDYDALNRSAYLYALGKDSLLSSHEEKAIGYINGMNSGSPLWPFALQMRASAYAILGKTDQALEDFRSCASRADKIVNAVRGEGNRVTEAEREADDLRARCLAGVARTLYQMERFEDSDRAYDRIDKASIVWPDILFEQAWTSFAKQEYNRSLGKLVSYKSPALTFVYNSEIDVLRAQSFLGLCLYSDANEAINEFNKKYNRVGEEVKRFVERTTELTPFYELGKAALSHSIYTDNSSYQMANRFVRGPYFRNLVKSEREVSSELQKINQMDLEKGFPGFLEMVLKWRIKSIRLLGGTFVKNSLIDYHGALIADFEKMAFIKLEMLKRSKDLLIYKKDMSGARNRGSVEPSRKDYQYYWSFNGEFWNDELGDYVFGLESECGKQQ